MLLTRLRSSSSTRCAADYLNLLIYTTRRCVLAQFPFWMIHRLPQYRLICRLPAFVQIFQSVLTRLSLPTQPQSCGMFAFLCVA